ncbi:MAG TPA: tetratricopeptide repeat protein [Kofleriaceae bacterium]|nr:tetratricopeptide repeat protein [Kofleriaceae bacterium]
MRRARRGAAGRAAIRRRVARRDRGRPDAACADPAADPARRFASLDALARALRPPPRRWPIVAGAGAIVTVAAIALAWPATDDETCTITPVDAVWNPARDQRIAAAFAAAGQRFAGPASSYARAAIERYVAQWSVLRDATCRAAQPAVARCLDRRATELDALLVRWERGDREDLASASQAVDALVPVERCGSPEVDAEPGALVPTAQLRAYERRLAAAHARFVAGEIEQAAADLAALDRELAATPFRALRAEVLLELAGDERDLGRPDPARDHLVAAVATAETAGAARIKALAWIELVALAADDGVRLPEARDALRLATAVIEHLGNPAELAEQRDLSAGLLALREGDHPRALELLRPVAIASSLAVTDRARRLQILARALVASGDVAAGLAELERAEHVLIEALGPDTPQLVFVYNSMIEPLDYLGRQRDAIARGERALAIVDASFGRDYPRRLVILDNVATIYANLGELDHALELQREVISGTTRVRGPDSYALAVALVNFGSTLVDAKRYAESIAPLDRGLAILSRLVRPEHPVIATAHATLAHAHSDLGHHALAIEHARRALAIREQLSTGPGYLAYNRFLLAEVLRAAGQLPEAIALVRSALALPLAKTGREGELAAQLRAWLASRATVARSGTDSP